MDPLPKSAQDKVVVARGCYADECGFPRHQEGDWEEGWLWLWRGRRNNSMVTDVISTRVTNFSGHVTLVPKGGKDMIAFAPRVSHPLFFDVYRNLAKAILQKDRSSILSSFKYQPSGKLNRDCPGAAWALEAGIEIKKVKVMYSPSRLQRLLDEEHLMSPCRYSWNVEIDKEKINCISVFYVWDIVKDIPNTSSMKDFYKLVARESIDLSSDDVQLAMTKLPLHEKELERLLMGMQPASRL